jgi:hypothetical protein
MSGFGRDVPCKGYFYLTIRKQVVMNVLPEERYKMFPKKSKCSLEVSTGDFREL